MEIRPALVAACCGVVFAAIPSDAQPLREVVRRVTPSVVVIRATAGPSPTAAGVEGAATRTDGLGSGVLVSADGKVVTAAHVVTASTAIEVSFLDGVPIPATVIAMAPTADIALLQLQRVPPEATVATFGDSDLLEAGDQVFTIGAPYGAGHSLAVGWISARRRPVQMYEDATPLELFQMDLDVFGGNSGGPVFTAGGDLVGLVTHVLGTGEGGGGPSVSVTGNVVRRLMLDNRRPWLGLESFMLEGPLAEAFHLPQPSGLLVQTVAPNSLAARLGLRGGSVAATVGDVPLLLGGDVIVEVLGAPVTASPAFMSGLLAALDRLQAGDTMSVRVWRGGQLVVLQAIVPAP